MDRSNHYEAAFEAYLQWHRLCYVAVDETRRAQLADERVKNLDFIVYGECGARLLVDVKGRRFPGGSVDRPRRVLECWSTQDDVDGLEQWTELFGPGYTALLVFAYHLLPEAPLPEDADDLWTWRGKRYWLRAVPIEDYRAAMRVRSPRWRTVSLPRKSFERLAHPFHHFTHPVPPIAEGCCRYEVRPRKPDKDWEQENRLLLQTAS
jgi:hypothetical protein